MIAEILRNFFTFLSLFLSYWSFNSMETIMLLDWFFIHLTKSCGETFQMKCLLVKLLRSPFSFCTL